MTVPAAMRGIHSLTDLPGTKLWASSFFTNQRRYAYPWGGGGGFFVRPPPQKWVCIGRVLRGVDSQRKPVNLPAFLMVERLNYFLSPVYKCLL